MQRPFTSGSRQAPDPFDQFLEENNFYRKHTARDSSCLFRTISEQMYDTQLHHLDMRKKCVNYMREHYSYFKKQVDRDLDEYLDDMSKPKTYGTLVELQAAALLFKRNVFLFEPYTLGNYFVFRAHFTGVFRVFYTPERHFDSVFTSDYIKDVAICQSICYEILYKDLFKLPDVTFAVEQMLHSSSLETTPYRSECNEDGYWTKIYMEDGRTFDFDLPENTNCILENDRLCHFHNEDFPQFSEELQRDLKNTKRDDAEYKFLSKTVDSLLPDRFISCVRQLLLEGITPFPYKVAKALDPNMYRNIEFDSWNEARKELKLQNWYNGDSNFKLMKYEKRRLRRILQVGAKCHVQLCKSENDLYTCHIQDMSVEKGYCIVFVEQLGEKRLVPYDSLKPLPPDQFKPWSLPYRLQRHIQKCNTYRYARQFNYRFKVDEQFTTEYCLPEMKSADYDDDPKQQNCIYKLKQFTHLENFRTHTMEYCTMPLTVEHNRDNVPDNKSQKNDSSRAPSRCSEVPKIEYEADNGNGGTLEGGGHGELDIHSEAGPLIYPATAYADEYYTYGFDPSVIQTGPQPLMPGGGAQVYYMCNASGYAPTGGMYMQAPPPTQVIATAQNHGSYYPQYYPMPPGGSSGYNITPSAHRRGQSHVTPLSGRINLDVKKSVKTNGTDLPVDIQTLRYFFNLGVEYHQRQARNLTNEMIDSKEGIVKSTTSESQGMKLDENANEMKSDNAANNPNANSNNANNYTTNKSSNSQRRFASRCFNNKDRQNYRPGQQNRFHQNDQHNNNGNKNQKSNANYQNQHSGQNVTPNSRNGSSSATLPHPGSANPIAASDMGMQHSPMVMTETGEMIQTSATYNSNGQIVTPYVTPYIQDFDQPPPPSGVYMPVPVGPGPYGIYAAAPSIGTGPVTMHSTGGFPYMTAPPPPLPSPVQPGPPQAQITPTYYATPTTESTATIIEGTVDPSQYPCIGYPPSVHFYYSPSGAVSTAGPQSGTSTAMGPPGYWCIPPPIQSHQSPQPQAVTVVTTSTNQPQTSNRRDIPSKQRHPSTGEQ